MDREKFKLLVNELEYLRSVSSDEISFLSKHYKKIESLLEHSQFQNDKADKYFYQNTYNLYKNAYLRFWYERLKPYRVGECSKNSLDELRIGKDYFIEFFQVLGRYSCLKQALGQNKLKFLRSNQIVVDALILSKECGISDTVIEKWQEAGETCKPSKKQNLMPEDYELLMSSENYFSQKYKLKAFFCLESQPNNFYEVITCLETSQAHATKAFKYCERYNRSLCVDIERHLSYIEYWLNIFLSRQSLLEKNIDKSIMAIKEAEKHARILDPKERNIFPNRFHSISDLENEENFILSAKALITFDLIACKDYLQKWIEHSDKIRGTWRYINVVLRKEAIDCLIEKYINKDISAYSKTIQKLKENLSSRPQVGNHTRSIIDIIEIDFKNIEDACEKIYAVYPLDSYPSELYKDKLSITPKEIVFQQLPPFYGQWLAIPDLYKKDVETAFLTIDYVFLSYLRVITEHCYYYYCLLTERGRINIDLPINFPTYFDKLYWSDVEKSVNSLYLILEKTKKGYYLRKLIEGVEIYQKKVAYIREKCLETHDISEVCNMILIREIVNIISDVISETGGYLYPHPIRVRSITKKIESDKIVYRLERIWGKDEKEMDLVLDNYYEKLKVDCFYFLGNKWKWKDYDYIEYIPREEEEFVKDIRSCISFGIPNPRCVLLYEGQTEHIVMPLLLNKINSYWTVLNISLILGDGDTTVERYKSFIQEGRYVVTIADSDVQVKAKWRVIILNKNNTFLIFPDFEGINLDYLIRAIKNKYRTLEIEKDNFRRIIDNRITRLGLKEWKGTLDGAYKEYLRYHYKEEDRKEYNVTKVDLAPLLAKEMIENGIPDQIEKALERVLSLAEGRVPY